MEFDYYYNNVPGDGLCRNNLIYTSLMSKDQKTFCQWYYNDPVYHKKENQVVDPALMNEKWARELCYLNFMATHYPDLVPEIKEIDLINKKIYLKVDGPDFWQQALDMGGFQKVLPDWEEQMLNIFKAHKESGLWKFSLHPSSYFVVDGKLKSINYFFCHGAEDKPFSLQDVESHIYVTRQEILKGVMKKLGYAWDQKLPFHKVQRLALESFRVNFPDSFTDKAIDLLDV